ncbi:hypothetical protein EXIGLDRAFT_844792 [Exidia glandulosa HHB12029]|uniref:C2H2-type domain-containing protein n=1 Tax=Exidia glandulosa HHB12029 TaxID=1314781 RepID=A0A165BTG6_EXIGL|nr:hypothetical protein EXIGLDRAFT_844792 [Exidia glandulosa HHB12029]
MVWCSLCDRYFSSGQAYWQHIDNSVRHECSFCYFHFEDQDQDLDHLEAEHERCGICRLWVADGGDAMHEHRLSDHANRYCSPCRRVFIGSSNLQSHLNSSLHRPKAIPCPHRSRGCTQSFVSHSAMTLHLESGHCVSGFTRADVNRRVIELDRGRVISDPSRLLTNGGAPAQYIVTERAWNGHAWECYLCHAEKRSRQALNAHLNSPRHEEKMYLCPQRQCAQRFTTLSALMQHIESDRCGVQRFKVVQQAIAQLTNGMRRLGQ